MGHDETLTGGAKAGYFCLGLFLGALGVLITWLVNRGKPVAEAAFKISIVGFLVWLVLGCAIVLIFIILPLVALDFI
jgi:hypothetical protein